MGPTPAIGVNFQCTWVNPYYTDAERDAVLDRLVAARVSWVRIDLAWAVLEDAGKGVRNSWYLEAIDSCVAKTRARGINILMMLHHTPGWANNNAGWAAPPANVADYREIAQWLAARYRGRVQAWEIWNEANIGTFWTGTTRQYVDLLKAGYAGVKAGDPGAPVVVAGPSLNDDAWVSSIYANGAKGHFDVMATHPYQWVGDEAPEAPDDGTRNRFSHLPAIKRVMDANGDGAKPIWVTEWGWSAHSNSGSEPSYARGVSEAVQADYLVRSIDYARTHWPYVTHMFWYKERAWDVPSSDPVWWQVHNEGWALLRPDRSPRPAFDALRRYLGG